ncbi:hypothetical protein JCM5350_002829 [Sporobolomyces pararoseus]
MPPRARKGKTISQKPIRKPKVDRISSLAPELLDYIFDLAYPLESPSTGPLSKHLLPFHIRGIYRRIDLERAPRIEKLIKKVETDPHLGALVQSIHFEHHDEDRTILKRDRIQRFFNNLPNLFEMDFGRDFSHLFQNVLVSDRFVHSESLRHLTLTGDLYLEPLIRNLPNLESLDYSYNSDEPYDILFVCCYNQRSCDCLDKAPLHSRLETLTIKGIPEKGSARKFATFFSLYPNLTLLSISLVNLEEGDFAWSSELVPFLSPKLVELVISDDGSAELIEHLLPRFTQLEVLVLDHEGFFSPDLPTHLFQLRSLNLIQLGVGTVALDQFIPLITGPNRLEQLAVLELDSVRSGYQRDTVIEEDDVGKGFREDLIPPGDEPAGQGWSLPRFDEEGGLMTIEGTRRLLHTAKGAGIECGGQLFDSLHRMDCFALEAVNVALYRSYRDKDLKYIYKLQEDHPEFAEQLPSMDFDSLDPSKLELEMYEREMDVRNEVGLIFKEQD